MGDNTGNNYGIANSEDPDQTAPLIWYCTVCQDLSVWKLRVIMVQVPSDLSISYDHVAGLSSCSLQTLSFTILEHM